MPKCIAKGCHNRSGRKSNKQLALEESIKITFHRFPQCIINRQLWLTSLGFRESSVHQATSLCFLHFKHEDFDKSSLSCVRLKPHAVSYVQGRRKEKFNYPQLPNKGSSFSFLPVLFKQEMEDKSDVSTLRSYKVQEVEISLSTQCTSSCQRNAEQVLRDHSYSLRDSRSERQT
ncbi:uncharacterized protein LOC143182523 isoform X2 [Calliopsis andreniformis]|uniref:uncharacterized protein LOC143182523 isoform X2 n=1 Tax=Calliopsis andreniformis TaxID=337506 RepID=UPI003FCD9C2A